MTDTMQSKPGTLAAAGMLCIASIEAFTVPIGRSNQFVSKTYLLERKQLFFATEQEEAIEEKPEQQSKGVQLFSDETLQEASDALGSVGWSGVAPASSSLTISEDQMGELTSDDPFVKVGTFTLHHLYGLFGYFDLTNCVFAIYYRK